MKPFKVLLFLLSVLGSLLVISFFIPQNGISLTGNIKFRFIAFNKIFSLEKIQYANISHIIENKEIADTLIDAKKHSHENLSSVFSIDSSGVVDDSLIKVSQRIEFPGNDSNAIYPFFLNLLKHEGVIRVLHYGDSQIEGDRISSYIRSKLQAKFGGSGAGLLPVVDAADVGTSVNKNHSENWKRFTLYGNKDSTVHHKKYCILESFSRFAPVRNDSAFKDTCTYYGWVTLNDLDKSGKKIRRCRVICGNNKRTTNIFFFSSGIFVKSLVVEPDNRLNIAECDFEVPPDQITIKFSGKDSPDVYAISLDDNKGIAVDNIPMRGSSGLDFNYSDLDLLKRSFENLNVKLLILEFGVNIVPNEVDDYGFYENWFYAQLRSLKRIKPDISIIVIGVSDMSKKIGDHYESYSNIEKIRDAQKKAAFRAGCAFWDLYKAMGGKNSMPSWVMAQPPLASTDFTHFNYDGSRIIAKMFYNSLIFEYNKFKRQQAGF